MLNIKKFQKEVASFLDIDVYKVKLEDLGEDMKSKLYMHDEYIAINKKYKKDDLMLMQLIAFEYRKLYQVKERIANANSSLHNRSMEYKNWISENRIDKELRYDQAELDANAFTRYYLKRFKGLDIITEYSAYLDSLDKFIKDNPNRFELDRVKKEKEELKRKDMED